MRNKSGFTLIEVLIGVTIIIGIVVSSIKFFNNGENEAVLNIMSKLQYTQKLGLALPATGYYKVNGEDSLPFIIFNNKNVTYLSSGEGQNTLITATEKYSKGTEDIKVETNLKENTLIFSPQGFVYDKDGKVVGNAHIYITKGNTVSTISIDCKGKISSQAGKDTSSSTVCKNTSVEGSFKFPDYSVLVCNDATEDMWNGKCLAKCGENEIRDSAGTCVCRSGTEKVDGKCLCKKRTESQKSGWHENWGNGSLSYTMPADGTVYFTNTSRRVLSLTVNGSSVNWQVYACGEVVCSSTSPSYPLKKGDRVYLYFWDGFWYIHATYRPDKC